MVHLTSSLIASLALATFVSATLAPSEPDPTTVWHPGQAGVITWADDNTAPLIPAEWTNMTIDFMTGDNLNQINVLGAGHHVATGVDASKSSTYTWTCPTVSPPSQIYFFMFTSGDGKYEAWTTRFTITAADGTTVVAPTNSTQPAPDNETIPWGIGTIVSSASTSAAAASSSAISTALSSFISATSTATPAASATSTTVSPTVKVNSAAGHVVSYAGMLGAVGLALMML
ncbi:hypothetical protein BC937DRAFT_86499 [Endogone sp. FLAS-F59071]|nr:hypothetical protein BC937DRAFT_86499 [Endogone sp. FLAS-F59071]|eukprot:RUS13009.1 hypothetical protein BC937DRAFT_86499 [Endogone sp. FLAS-F59071]